MTGTEKRILVIAAHPDDEVLGMGGTIAKHARAGDEVHVTILTEGASVQFPNELDKIILKSKQLREAARILGVSQVFEGKFPDQMLDTFSSLEIVQFIEGIIGQVQPQTIYTHHFTELNPDHRVCCETTTIAARPFNMPYLERILCFSVDTLSIWGQGTAQYNIYNDITDTLETKIDAMRIYATEVRESPHPRSLEALRSMASRNGAMVGLRAAEVFQSILEIRR